MNSKNRNQTTFQCTDTFLTECKEALEIGIENTQQLLADHDERLGRGTSGNKHTAEMLEDEIKKMRRAAGKIDLSLEFSKERNVALDA